MTSGNRTGGGALDCHTPFSCSGDAAQCAIALIEHQRLCEWEDDTQKVRGLAMTGDDVAAMQPSADAALNKDGSSDFDIWATFQAKRQDYLKFTSYCTPMVSFDYKGQHFDIDISIVCQIGEFVRLLVHIAAYMFLLALFSKTVGK